MAVIVKYIVVRNGEEKMTFATKKEADAHDKMLDVADNLFEFLEKTDIKLNEQQMENISLKQSNIDSHFKGGICQEKEKIFSKTRRGEKGFNSEKETKSKRIIYSFFFVLKVF